MFDPAIWIGAIIMGLSLGLLGSGGSILTVPLLVYVALEPEKMAIAQSLLIVGIVSLVGSISHFIKGKVDLKLVAMFGVPSMFFAYFGAYLSQFVSAQVQMIVFACVMLAASVFMLKPLKNKMSASLVKQTDYSAAQFVMLIFAGVCVGSLAGLVGVGGGFLIVPALLIIAKISMQSAIATSLFIIAMQSFSGFAKYLFMQSNEDGGFNTPLIILISTCAILGVLLGTKLVNKLPQARLKQVFGVSLIPLSVFILFSNT